MNHDEFDDEYWVSKTDLKKEASKAQAIGEQLLTVSSEFLESLKLDEHLVDAIELAKRIRDHRGKRRQIQLVGKLMRREDIEPIEKALATLHQAKTSARDSHHLAERIRDNLIANGDKELERLMPDADNHAAIRSELKQLANAKLGTPNHKKHTRTVFRLVREGLDS